MPKVVLARKFLGPDGRLYPRVNNADDVLVHNFPDSWTLPKKARSAEEVIAAAPAVEPEPETLSEITKKSVKV